MSKIKEIADELEKALTKFHPNDYGEKEVLRLAGQLVGAVQCLPDNPNE